MISSEILEKISRQQQMALFPNVVREYLQHVFLSELYKIPESSSLLFKGGTALRIVYHSPRFSEDLDFSLFGVKDVKTFVEDLFVKVLERIEALGIKVEVSERSNRTSGGYFGLATFHLPDFQPVGIEINISDRNGRPMNSEIDSITNDFVPTYTVIHLPQVDIAEEKVFGALLARKKPRDFYDLYYMMRARLLTGEQKKRLAEFKDKIISDAKTIDFRNELGVFLPQDQQSIIRDFVRALESEIKRQIV